MLHTKFHGNRFKGSGKEEFEGFFLTYMGITAILVMRPASYHVILIFL